MHPGRHPRRVRVPVEQVKRERILAHQVIVDHERPYQVVGAQQVEGGRHLRAFEIATLVHLLFEIGDLLLVNEHAQLARLREVQQADEEGGASDLLLSLGREIRERGAEQRAAQAIANDVNLGLAGGVHDGLERGDRSFHHVVVEDLGGEAAAGVHPGDHEHRVAPVHRPLDETVLLSQIENVVLVDPGRDNQ